MDSEKIMPGRAVRWRITGRVAQLILDRPAKRNALRMDDWRDFKSALDDMASVGARSVVIGAADHDMFCAGSDLSELAGLADSREGRVPFAAAMDSVMRQLAEGPMVTIAAIAGPCLGAGVAVAMACNIRIAEATARFAIPPARFGISYPASDVRRLAALVGPGHAARLLYCTETIDAAEAQRIGLVEILAANARERATQLADMAVANSPESIALLKGTLTAPGPFTPDDEQFIASLGSEDFRRFVSNRKV